MGLWNCVKYLACTGAAGFILGRLLPKKWFQWERFPYRGYHFEQDGLIYNKIKIRKWQNRLPDMSKILPFAMPAKKLNGRKNAAELAVMLRETCVAELIHGLFMFTGFACIPLWPGIGGIMVSVLYALGNLPFVLIQRFNRPRLLRLYERAAKEVCV